MFTFLLKMLIFHSNSIYKAFFFFHFVADVIVFVLLSFHTHKQIHQWLRSLALCLSCNCLTAQQKPVLS